MEKGPYRCRDPPGQALPTVLFTGTTLRYLVREVKGSGELKPGPLGKLYLTHHYFTAASFAEKRARQYGDYPTILAVNPMYLHEIPKKDAAGYAVNSLTRGSFFPLKPVYPKNLDDEEGWDMVNGFPNVVRTLKPDDLAEVVDRFCQEYLKQSQPLQPSYLVPKIPRRDS